MFIKAKIITGILSIRMQKFLTGRLSAAWPVDTLQTRSILLLTIAHLFLASRNI